MKKIIVFSIYLIIISVISVLLMDVYGMVGDTKEVTIEIKPNDSLDSIARELQKDKIILNKTIFKQFFKMNTRKNVIVPGTIIVNSKMTYESITRIIDAPETNTMKITIPEGFEIREIVTRFANNDIVNNEDDFKNALKNFKYTLKSGDKLDGDPYMLSGYLFPDTYEFYKTSTANEIITRMVDNFDKHWTTEYQAQAKKIGMTMTQIVTLASIIEREANKEVDFPKVSSVFHNRLKMNKPLESCATVQYILEERRAILSILNTKIESPFNTYKYAGLPPSPISSPGDLAIKAALFPDDTDKIFFFTDKNGDNRYSVTYEEHNQQIKKYGLLGG